MTRSKKKVHQKPDTLILEYCDGCMDTEDKVGPVMPCDNSMYKFNENTGMYLDTEVKPIPLYCEACWNREMDFRALTTVYPVETFPFPKA